MVLSGQRDRGTPIMIVDRVRIERKKRNISQLKLANILGFQSPNYVAKIETKKHNVYYNISHLYKISQAFDLKLSSFFEEQNEKIENNSIKQPKF